MKQKLTRKQADKLKLYPPQEDYFIEVCTYTRKGIVTNIDGYIVETGISQQKLAEIGIVSEGRKRHV